MKTMIAVEKIVLVRVDEKEGDLHIYLEGFEKPFLIDKHDEMYEHYLAQFSKVK